VGDGRLVASADSRRVGCAHQSIIFQGATGFLPFGIAIARDGTARVTNADRLLSSLSRFELANGTLTKLFERPVGHQLKGIAIDSYGNVWASSAEDNTVYVFDEDGKKIGAFSGVGGMSWPWGLAVDGDDNVWVADFGPMVPGNRRRSGPPYRPPAAGPRSASARVMHNVYAHLNLPQDYSARPASHGRRPQAAGWRTENAGQPAAIPSPTASVSHLSHFSHPAPHESATAKDKVSPEFLVFS
jgi:hypothetical protein